VRIDGREHPVCCAGCEAAATLILSQGLGRFYEFRELPTAPPPGGTHNWSAFDREAALRRYTHECPGGERELSLQIEGLHCAACAWLIESSLRRAAGVRQIHVNASTARAELRFDPHATAPSRLLARIHALGFVPLPLSFAGDAAEGTAERRYNPYRSVWRLDFQEAASWHANYASALFCFGSCSRRPQGNQRR
jgi:Cu2+-exporting ATPase